MRAFTIVLFMCICIIASTFAAVAIIPADKTPGNNSLTFYNYFYIAYVVYTFIIKLIRACLTKKQYN